MLVPLIIVNEYPKKQGFQWSRLWPVSQLQNWNRFQIPNHGHDHGQNLTNFGHKSMLKLLHFEYWSARRSKFRHLCNSFLLFCKFTNLILVWIFFRYLVVYQFCPIFLRLSWPVLTRHLTGHSHFDRLQKCDRSAWPWKPCEKVISIETTKNQFPPTFSPQITRTSIGRRSRRTRRSPGCFPGPTSGGPWCSWDPRVSAGTGLN